MDFLSILRGEKKTKTEEKPPVIMGNTLPHPVPVDRIQIEEPKPSEPKPRRIITHMTVRNNIEPHRYFYNYDNREGNPFGLTWRNDKEGGFVVVQKISADGEWWEALGRFTDHSVTSLTWETVVVPEGEKAIIIPEPNEK